MNKNIAEQIKDTVRPIFARQVDAKLERIQKLREIKSSDAYKQTRDAWTKRELLAAFSKKELMLASNGWNYCLAVFEKEAEQQLRKINVAVARKLSDVDVEGVECVHCGNGKDGYVEGAWKITAQDGNYYFEFRTIYAGGFNIQCLHVRTVYTLNKVK